ncbi:hypothetical protein HRG_013268 [Hirsutella rhossiliensis]
MANAIIDVTKTACRSTAPPKKNTVNVDEGGIMSGFGLDSLVVGSADPKRKALLKGPQRDQPMPQMLD